VLGILMIARRPEVLAALNPGYALAMLAQHPAVALAILGAVFQENPEDTHVMGALFPCTLGLIGGPIYLSSVIGIVLGLTVAGSAWQGVGGLFMFAWEAIIGLWMIFKGFDRSAPLVVAATDESAGRAAAASPS